MPENGQESSPHEYIKGFSNRKEVEKQHKTTEKKIFVLDSGRTCAGLLPSYIT